MNGAYCVTVCIYRYIACAVCNSKGKKKINKNMEKMLNEVVILGKGHAHTYSSFLLFRSLKRYGFIQIMLPCNKI